MKRSSSTNSSVLHRLFYAALFFSFFVSTSTLIPSSSFAGDDWIIMAGPMFHYGLGTGEWTFALEGSYWVSPFVGADFGLEYGKKTFIAYSELQGGVGLAGISAGPYIDFRRRGQKLGVQTTVWANYFLGADYRWRTHPEKNKHYLGVYFKLPVASYADGSGDSDDSDDSDIDVIDIVF